MADASGIDVHEIRGWIVADAAELQRTCGNAQVVEPHPRHPDVDRLAVHVQAVARHAGGGSAALTQQVVGSCRPIAGDDVERLIRFERAAQLVQQVEQLRIDRFDLVGAKVAKNVIDFRERIGTVGTAAAVRRLQSLPGMGVEKRQHALRRRHLGKCGGAEPRRHHGDSGGSGAEAEEATPIQFTVDDWLYCAVGHLPVCLSRTRRRTKTRAQGSTVENG